MDIYTPEGDSIEKRPLVIFMHGGYFFFGDKSSFEKECEELAHGGFVAATISYRLIDVEDDSFMVAKKAVVDAMHDLKAAIRFFNMDAETNNKYKIDPDNIFIGGYSAGAITSLHTAYATSTADFNMMNQPELAAYVEETGGIEGKSGNAGYSSKVRGVVNFAGSLFDVRLIDKNEPILFSVHGNKDEVVPLNNGIAGTTKITTQGSALIHKQANKVGITNKLRLIKGADHISIWQCDDCIEEIRAFLIANLI